MDWFDMALRVLRELFPLVNFLILLVIVFISRRWTGVSIASRQDASDTERAVMRGNIRRIEMDYERLLRDTQEGNQQVILEVQTLTTVVKDTRSVIDRVTALEARADECAQHIVACPVPGIKGFVAGDKG